MNKLLFITILTCATCEVNAQYKPYIHAGLSLPSQTVFAPNNVSSTEQSQIAKTSFVVGVKGYIPTKINGLSLFHSTDVLISFLNKNFKDKAVETYNPEKITYSKYISVPVLGGLNYAIDINEKSIFFIEGSAGANFFKITPSIIKEKEDRGEPGWITKATASLSTKLAYKMGAGISFGKVAVGAYYYGLGKHTPNMRITEGYEDDIEDEQNGKFVGLNVSAITIGLSFLLR